MKLKTQTRPTSFFAQSWLILLPVLVLAIIGFFALQQDRRAIEADAKERAHQLAARWIQSISLEWAAAEENSTNRLRLLHALSIDQAPRGYFFEMDSQGRLLFPPPYPAVPEPQPLVPAELNAEQAGLWEAVQKSDLPAEAEAAQTSPDYQRFLETKPSLRFAAATRFALGCSLARRGQMDSATEILHSLTREFPGELSEAGLPFEHLAYLRLFQLGLGRAIAREILTSNAVYRPSLLTPKLLEYSDQATAMGPASIMLQSHGRTIWQRHELTRNIFEAMQKEFVPRRGRTISFPPAFAVSLDKPVAVVRISAADAETIKLVALPVGEAPMQSWVRYDLACARSDVFGVTVIVAGLDVYEEGYPENPIAPPANAGRRGPAKTAWPLLAAETKTDENAEVLKVQVHLANSALFYARHRIRTAWIGAVIASAAAVAVLGWITARRAFARQERLNEMKTNFVSSVSHELRAPIATVRLMAEGLESGRIQEETKKHEYFKFIVQECRRLGSLIENVLDFSRIEQGRKQYEFEPTDVSALIRQTAKLMEPYAAEKQICLQLALTDSQLLGPPKRLATAQRSEDGTDRASTQNSQPILDGRAIQQALVNLIDNAIKHSPKGSAVTIGLDLPAETQADSRLTDNASRFTSRVSRLHLWVEDHGEGIPREEHERIFERFYRLGSELRRETQGVGIGLSLVKHIVEAHSGRVFVRSAVGQGSRFTIELPVNLNSEHRTSPSAIAN